MVDDDPDIREMLGFTPGHRVRDPLRIETAATPSRSSRCRPPAAMLLDVMMPGVDGYDVLEVRRERGLAPDTCIVMLTCKSDERVSRAQLGPRRRRPPHQADGPGADRRASSAPTLAARARRLHPSSPLALGGCEC